MRISIRKDDPGYDYRTTLRRGHGWDVSIFVDGVDVTGRCHTADEEEGKAWCFKHNELGIPFTDPDFPDRAVEKVLTGKVVILLNDRMNGNDSYSCH